MHDGDTGIQAQRDSFIVNGDFSINIVFADNQSSAAGFSISNMQQGANLTVEELAIVNALREYGPKSQRVARRLLGMIDDLASCLPSVEERPPLAENAAGVVETGGQVG